MPCTCSLGTFKNMMTTEVAEQLVKNLTVNKTHLSLERRKLTSAKDERTSSQTIGTVGVAAIAIVVGVFVFLDIVGVLRSKSSTVRRSKRGRQGGRRRKRNAVHTF